MPNPPRSRRDLQHLRIQRQALAFLALVIVAILTVGGWQSWTGYRQYLEMGEVNSENLARAAAQHAEDAIKELEAFSFGMIERLESYGLDNVDKPRMQRLFKNQARVMSQIHGIFIYDQEGNWLIADKDTIPPNANSVDREYFIYHKSHHNDHKLHIGPVIKSRSTGDLVIPVSRRINNPDGSFAGVFLVTLYVDYFIKFYESFRLDEQGIFVIALRDGTVLARRPFVEKMIGTSLAKGEIYTKHLPYALSGTAHITSVVDQVQRVNSYRQLERYPVVVQAGLSRQAVLAPWYQDLYRSAVVVAVVILALLFFGSVLLRQIRFGIAAEKELRQAHAALETLALQDSLTGLANRRHLDAVLLLEISRARRTHTPLGLVMIDIDHFKRYNDLYGHPAGDACIKTVSDAVKASVRRAGDLAVRYGGEEIMVLLPGSDEVGTYQVAENIAEAIRELRIVHAGSEHGYVTISIGTYTYSPSEKGLTPNILIKAADEALYAAKEQGRNRIHPSLCLL
ncbi:diguanylate cyclase [Pseudomonas duriflava]|uniref:diguanylate cyclase n=1 Tax=Pseudomonas duriflava TaxID=459528 RepID=A0A562Q719_9PSED|nr:sensor domain-containing diguanylate cyclase [Pseudomonas duriflava]TWI52529.1 diguanylate cyclase [Pseudomonas duriflava]